MSYPKIITILGDSVSLNHSERGISYKDTYPYKLQYLLNPSKYHIRARNRGGNYVNNQALPEHIDTDILSGNTEYVIIHLGIVDCAPRLFTRLQKGVIAAMERNPVTKLFSDAAIKFKSKNRMFFTRYFPKTDVPPKMFREKYGLILQKIKESGKIKKVFMINIADTSEENKKKSYNFGKNILEYNQILKDLAGQYPGLCELIDFYSATAKRGAGLIIEQEGIHLTKEGNDYLARLLYEKIQNQERVSS